VSGIRLAGLATGLAAVAVGVVTVALAASRGAAVAAASFQLSDAIWTFSQVGFVCVGLLVLRYARAKKVGWAFFGAGMLPLLGTFAYEYAYRGLRVAPGSLAGADEATIVYYLFNTAIGAWFALSVLLFPTGTLPSSRWRWAVVLAATGIFVTVMSTIVLWSSRGTALLEEAPHLSRQARVAWDLPYLFTLPAILAAMASVVARYRRAGQIERLQLKWFFYAVLFTVAGVIVGPLTPSFAGEWGDLFASLGTLTVPCAVAVAMLKYRLYDIDVVINRTLVYGSLSAVLVGAYALGVLVFRALLDPITGDNDLAIAASTLAVAALFGPARRRIQSFIDRRFYRSRYDAQKTLETFAARVRDEVELDVLSGDLLEVVRTTVAPRHASVWVRGGEA